jgi:hypothetical protein
MLFFAADCDSIAAGGWGMQLQNFMLTKKLVKFYLVISN